MERKTIKKKVTCSEGEEGNPVMFNVEKGDSRPILNDLLFIKKTNPLVKALVTDVPRFSKTEFWATPISSDMKIPKIENEEVEIYGNAFGARTMPKG